MSYSVTAVVQALATIAPDELYLRRGDDRWRVRDLDRASRSFAAGLDDADSAFRWHDRDPLAVPDQLVGLLRIGRPVSLLPGSPASIVDVATGGRRDTVDVDVRETRVHSATPALLTSAGTVTHGELLDRAREVGAAHDLGPGRPLDTGGDDVEERVVAVVAALVTPCAIVLP